MAYEGEVDTLIKRLQTLAKNAQKRGIVFAPTKLNVAGSIYEKYGYNAARIYLVSRDAEMERVLVEALEDIHATLREPMLGGLILKRLDKILKFEEGK